MSDLLVRLNAVVEKHKVELASAQEVDASSKIITAAYGQLSKAITDYNDKSKILSSLAQDLAVKSASTQKVYDDFEKKVKELGLTLPNDFLIKKQTLQNFKKMAEKLRLKPLIISASPNSY